MRYVSMFVVVVVVFLAAIAVASLAAAEPLLTPRPVDPIAIEAFARARTQSASVRAMIAVLEQSDVIVHIESSRSMPAGISGMTRFVTSRGGHRYVRITINIDLPPKARSIILGHELQHACELAASQAADAASVRALFEHTGDRTGIFFETRAALETERHVRKEIYGRRLQAEPVVKFDH